MEGFGRRLLDLELMVPLRPAAVVLVPEPAAAEEIPGHDPRSTTASHIEGAYEPPVGFGLTAHVEARDGRSGRAG